MANSERKPKQVKTNNGSLIVEVVPGDRPYIWIGDAATGRYLDAVELAVLNKAAGRRV